MKTFIIVAFVILSSVKLNAQTFTSYADTANYLIAQIEQKKGDYIGKPFSILYDSLKIKPVNAITADANIQSTFGKSLIFDFNNYKEFSKEHYIIVNMDTAPAYNSIYPLLFPGVDQPINIAAIVDLYKPLLIKDIVVKDYQQDEPVNPAVIIQVN